MVGTPSRNEQQLLDYQKRIIEDLLFGLFSRQFRVWSAVNMPAYVRYTLSGPVGRFRIRQIEQAAAELSNALGVGSVRVSMEEGNLCVDVPTRRKVVTFKHVAAPPQKWGITLGLALGSPCRPLTVNLSDPASCHVLVGGTTGSGKTVLERCLMLSAALHSSPRQLLIAIIDLKLTEFEGFAGLKHLAFPIARDMEAAGQILAWAVQEMRTRYEHGVQKGFLADKARRPRVLIVVDEVVDLVQDGGKLAERGIVKLIREGRGVGIHLVLGTQKPMAHVIGSLVTANLPLRICGAVGDARHAHTILGVAGSGGEKLLGDGDFLTVRTGGSGVKFVRFQTPYIEDTDVPVILRRYGLSGPDTTVRLQGDWKHDLRQLLNVGDARGGRNQDDIAQYILDWVAEQTEIAGEPPAPHALGKWHKEEHGSLVRSDKAKRAIDMALEEMGRQPIYGGEV